MYSFFNSPLLLLVLTLFFYFSGVELQKRYKWAIFHPVILSIGCIIGYLVAFQIPYETYEQSSQVIDFWLKPSIVALGVPLYIQLKKIKKMLVPLLLSQLIGSIVGIISVCFLAKWFGAEDYIILSLAPKSVTTPIAMEISKTIGGTPSLTAVSVIITGLFGMIFGVKILSLLPMKTNIGKGIAMGTASHALGIVGASKVSEKYAAYASLGLICNGIFTSIFTPLIIYLLKYFQFL